MSNHERSPGRNFGCNVVALTTLKVRRFGSTLAELDIEPGAGSGSKRFYCTNLRKRDLGQALCCRKRHRGREGGLERGKERGRRLARVLN